MVSTLFYNLTNIFGSATMEITVTSRVTIKPSSPTPNHLKHLKLSLMDQFLPHVVCVRILFFYSAGGDVDRFQNTNTSQRLRSSLSEALTEFYPLAGRFNNNETIECNDQGLEFVEARVKAPLTLRQLRACPKVEELDQLIPYDMFNYGTGFKGLCGVQATIFEECGGMTIGISMSHVLGDATSLGVFANRWAAIARWGDDAAIVSKTDIHSPIFGMERFFPPRDIPAFKLPEGGNHKDSMSPPPKLLTRNFVFQQAKIDALKSNFEFHRPTRVEVLSALILRCLIKVSKARSPRDVTLGMSFDLRRRMNPPVPTHHFGNMGFSWKTEPTGPESLNELGMQVRKLIRHIDSDYVETLLADDALLLFERYKQLRKPDNRTFHIRSWCGIPFYEVDVGWGAPAWIASVYPYYGDSVAILDAKNGDGMEAWVTLEEDEMIDFQSDTELLDFASVVPV